MKKIIFTLALVFSVTSYSQSNLEDLLAAGIADAQRFASEYVSPAAEGIIHSLSNGWVQTAQVKDQFKFEISVIGNASFIKDEKKAFLLNTNDYNNLYFRDGSISKNVATAFGENNPDIRMYAIVTDDSGLFQEEVEFNLPQGLGAENMSFIPSAFLQGRVGVFEATELKVRFFPKIDYGDVEAGLWGFGVQHEVSKWFPGEEALPVAVAAFIGFTSLNSSYDFTGSNVISGNNQRFESKQNSWLFQLQGSTTLPVINFYGGLGYVTGTSEMDVLGTYTVESGTPINESQRTFHDPFSVNHKFSGLKASVGTKLQLGIFAIFAEFNLAEFNTAVAGIGFGI